jgi:hypothetical protein
MTPVSYSAARTQQLRVLLWVAFGMGAAALGLAVFVLVGGGSARFAAFLAVPACALLPSSLLSVRSLDGPGSAARIGTVLTGGALIVVGLLLASVVIGILPSIVGILLVLLALLPDAGEDR